MTYGLQLFTFITGVVYDINRIREATSDADLIALESADRVPSHAILEAVDRAVRDLMQTAQGMRLYLDGFAEWLSLQVEGPWDEMAHGEIRTVFDQIGRKQPMTVARDVLRAYVLAHLRHDEVRGKLWLKVLR